MSDNTSFEKKTKQLSQKSRPQMVVEQNKTVRILNLHHFYPYMPVLHKIGKAPLPPKNYPKQIINSAMAAKP